MNQQLIYTSAPKGLRVGSRGFTTVASTSGMAKNLAERLEALSGYRHIFPPNDPKAHLNPVNYSYVRTRVGGRVYRVLSRVADAGLDHTQRTNKIAHHITVDPKQAPNVGPAWLESQVSFFEDHWDKEPQIIEHAKSIPQGTQKPTACHAWKEATGDAGWAGVLAASIMGHAKGDAYLIYDPGFELLPLFLEAQGLLSPELRWAATFSTYYSKLPAGTECRWRGVVRGSHEALHARKSRDNLVLDLQHLDESAPKGPLVQYARTGIGPLEEDKPALVADSKVDPISSRQDDERPGLPPPLPVGGSEEQRPPRLPEQKRVVAVGNRRRKRSKLFSTLVVAICGLLLFAAGSLAALFWLQLRESEVSVSPGAEQMATLEPEHGPRDESVNDAEQPDTPLQIVQPDSESSSSDSDRKTSDVSDDQQRAVDAQSKAATPDQPAEGGASVAIPESVAAQSEFPVEEPQLSSSIGLGLRGVTELGSLGDRNIADLRLVGEVVKPTGLALRRDEDDGEVWVLDAKGIYSSDRHPLGELKVDDGKLRWLPAEATQRKRWWLQTMEQLEYAVLDLTLDTEAHYIIAMRETSDIKPLRISAEKQGLSLSPKDNQFVTIWITGSSSFASAQGPNELENQGHNQFRFAYEPLKDAEVIISLSAADEEWHLSSQLKYRGFSLADLLEEHRTLQDALERHLTKVKEDHVEQLKSLQTQADQLRATTNRRSNELRNIELQIESEETVIDAVKELLKSEKIDVNHEKWEEIPGASRIMSRKGLRKYYKNYNILKLKEMKVQADQARIQLTIMRSIPSVSQDITDLKTISD